MSKRHRGARTVDDRPRGYSRRHKSGRENRLSATMRARFHATCRIAWKKYPKWSRILHIRPVEFERTHISFGLRDSGLVDSRSAIIPYEVDFWVSPLGLAIRSLPGAGPIEFLVTGFSRLSAGMCFFCGAHSSAYGWCPSYWRRIQKSSNDELAMRLRMADHKLDDEGRSWLIQSLYAAYEFDYKIDSLVDEFFGGLFWGIMLSFVGIPSSHFSRCATAFTHLININISSFVPTRRNIKKSLVYILNPFSPARKSLLEFFLERCEIPFFNGLVDFYPQAVLDTEVLHRFDKALTRLTNMTGKSRVEVSLALFYLKGWTLENSPRFYHAGLSKATSWNLSGDFDRYNCAVTVACDFDAFFSANWIRMLDIAFQDHLLCGLTLMGYSLAVASIIRWCSTRLGTSHEGAELVWYLRCAGPHHWFQSVGGLPLHPTVWPGLRMNAFQTNEPVCRRCALRGGALKRLLDN